MKFRKVMSALLAGAMVLSMSATAFASTTDITTVDGMTEGQVIEVTGKTNTANIKITVPTTGSIVLNPYGLSYTDEVVTTASTAQVISAVQAIKNESELPVKVSTSVTGTIEGATFATATAVAENEKKVFLEFGVEKIANVADGAKPVLTSPTKKTLSTAAVNFDPITLDEKTGAKPSLAFGFTGDASKNPTNAWTADDIVGATIAFTFALDNSGAGGGGAITYTVTKGSVTGQAGSGAIAINKTSAAAGDTVTITVTPDTNPNVAITVTNADSTTTTATVNPSNANEYTFTMPAQNVTVSAVFSA